jgi:hypothetical protein
MAISTQMTDPRGAPQPRTPVAIGKVIELAVHDIRSMRPSLVDLETGAVIVPDLTKVGGDNPQGRQWFREQGIDLVGYARTDSGDSGFGGYELIAEPIDAKDFDSIDLARAKRVLKVDESPSNASDSFAMISTRSSLPVTRVFRTREGSIGVLQVTEARLTDSPATFRIRYRLLSGAKR